MGYDVSLYQINVLELHRIYTRLANLIGEEIYPQTHKNNDGLLEIQYCGENTFGSI